MDAPPCQEAQKEMSVRQLTISATEPAGFAGRARGRAGAGQPGIGVFAGAGCQGVTGVLTNGYGMTWKPSHDAVRPMGLRGGGTG